MKPMIIDFDENKIILSSAFKKNANIPGTLEYQKLQEVRRDYPGFKLVTRQFKKNANQNRHEGLTYDYMESYIQDHDDDNGSTLAKFNDMRATSDEAEMLNAKSMTYGYIKSWFLLQYPEFGEFQKKRKKALEKKVIDEQEEKPAEQEDKATELKLVSANSPEEPAENIENHAA